MNINSVYLNGKINKDIFMSQLPGFWDKKYPDWVCLLSKGLYGIKQVGRLWYTVIKVFLLKIGFKQLDADPCVFIWITQEGTVIISLYINDHVNAKVLKAVVTVKKQIFEWFDVKNLGPAEFVVGLQVSQGEWGIKLTQATYVSKMLKEIDLTNASLYNSSTF